MFKACKYVLRVVAVFKIRYSKFILYATKNMHKIEILMKEKKHFQITFIDLTGKKDFIAVHLCSVHLCITCCPRQMCLCKL